MAPFDRSLLRAVEAALAATFLLIVAAELDYLPQPYPTWPELAGIPANPVLIVPGLLAVAALVGVAMDGLSLPSLAVAALAVPTLLIAVLSVRTLLAADGGVFWGGLFTMVVGVALAVAVLVRTAVVVREESSSDGPSVRFDR